MMRCLVTLGFLCSSILWGHMATAEDVGREINWQTVNSPNYQSADQSADETVESQPDIDLDTSQQQTFRLPSLPDEEGAGQSLSQSLNIRVQRFELEGSTVLSAADVATLTAGYTNRKIATADLQAIRLLLSRAYLDRGYVNSGVLIPDQNVADGVVRLNAIEGQLADIDIARDTHLRDHYIESRLARYIASPLNIENLQYALQQLQRDPMIERLDARLLPGDAPGEGVLGLAVQEVKRFELSLGADNHRASSIGAERGVLGLTTRNLTGFGEVFRGSGSLSSGTRENAFSLEVPVTRWNTRLEGYYSDSDSDIVEDVFKDLDINSLTDTWGVSLIQPVYQGLDRTVSLSVGYEEKHSETELLGIPFSFSPGAVDGESDTRVAMIGFDWLDRGTDHVLALRGTFRKGLDRNGATLFEPADDLDRLINPTGADGEFTAFLGQAMYLHRLNGFSRFAEWNERAQLVLRSTMQLSADPLLSLEKIAMGGVNTVRGYPENLLVRDNGVALSLELQLPIPGYRSEPGLRNLIIAPFLDLGSSWDDKDTDPTSLVRDTDEVRYLIGAGLGFLWKPVRGFDARLFWGLDVYDNFDGDDPRDLGNRDKDAQDLGIHFSLSYTASF